MTLETNLMFIKHMGQPSGAWRRLAALGAIGLVVAVSGCTSSDEAGTSVAQGTTSSNDQTLIPAGPSAQAVPSQDVAVNSSDVPLASDAEVTSSEDARAEPTEADPETPATPTRSTLPEPELSDEQIRETYGDDSPELAEGMVGTLCNLNRPHLEELSERVVVDSQIDDQMLRMVALSLSDDLGVWEGMAWQVPGVEEEIEVAREVYAHWEYAVGLVDAGDHHSAMEEWNAAAELIGDLPPGGLSEVGC